MNKKLFNIIGLVFIGIMFLVLGLGAIQSATRMSQSDYDDEASKLLQEAYEKRMQAKAEHCSDIGQNYFSCYSAPDSEKEACATKLAQLKVNFFNEYGEYDDLSCTTQSKPFFVDGVALN